MSALPTFLLACVAGFYANGMPGLMIGAVAGYVACGVSTAITEFIGNKRAQALAECVGTLKALTDAQAETNRQLANIARATVAILDAQPVLHHDLLALRTSRTQDEWDRVGRRMWPLLHRRLVSGWGLDADSVRRAQGYILDQHGSGNPLPRSNDELAKMVAGWKASQEWATKQAVNPTPTSNAEFAAVIAEQEAIMDAEQKGFPE